MAGVPLLLLVSLCEVMDEISASSSSDLAAPSSARGLPAGSFSSCPGSSGISAGTWGCSGDWASQPGPLWELVPSLRWLVAAAGLVSAALPASTPLDAWLRRRWRLLLWLQLLPAAATAATIGAAGCCRSAAVISGRNTWMATSASGSVQPPSVRSPPPRSPAAASASVSQTPQSCCSVTRARNAAIARGLRQMSYSSPGATRGRLTRAGTNEAISAAPAAQSLAKRRSVDRTRSSVSSPVRGWNPASVTWTLIYSGR